MSYSTEKFKEICQTPGLSAMETNMSDLEISIMELEQIDLLATIDKAVEEITLEDVLRTNFQEAHRVILRFDIRKRIRMLQDLDERLVYLYQSTKEYNDKGFGKSMSPKDFQTIMGRIKHLEIIQNWLYGIE